jgi:DNA-binding HxlR family transcriptional regulator
MGGRDDGARAGSMGLALLADPLTVGILDSLTSGALPLTSLRQAVGAPPKTTLRSRLRALEEVGAVNRRQDRGFPGQSSYESTPSGRALNSTAEVLAEWLEASPGSALQIGSPAARSAIKALVGGWSTNMLRALAAKPLSLTELDRVLTGVNYPAIERRLDAMRLTGQVVSKTSNGARPYSLTRWMREAVVPLVAAIGWERYSTLETPALGRLDVEALFLLVMPILMAPETSDGDCRLEVHLQGPKNSGRAGVVVTLEGGRVISCRTGLRDEARNWVAGTPAGWLSALSGRRTDELEFGGDSSLPEILIAAFRTILASPVGKTT